MARHWRSWGAMALCSAVASHGCGGEAIGEALEGGAGAIGRGGAGGMGGGRGGMTARGGRDGQGGTAMAGASGIGGSAMAGQGPGMGGSAGAGGASMGGSAGAAGMDGSCSSPMLLGPDTAQFFGHVERASDSEFDVCPGVGPEAVMVWTPPSAGRYLIDTFGSFFDTVLYVSPELSCAPPAPAPQRQCNDDFSGVQSLLRVESRMGEDMLIVVDSYNSSGGDFVLHVRGELPCPHQDAGARAGILVTVPEFASMAQLLPSADPSECRGGELGTSILWEAPADGDYRFSTDGSGFPTVMSLRTSCGGAFLGCDDDADGDGDTEVVTSLIAGEQVVIEVSPLELQLQEAFGQLVLNAEQL